MGKKSLKILVASASMAAMAIAGGFFLSKGFFGESKIVIENEDEVTGERQEQPLNTPVFEQDMAVENDMAGENQIKKEDEVAIGMKNSVTSPEEKTKKKDTLGIVNRLVSFGQEKRTSRKIDTIIIHSSYDALGAEPFSVSGIIKEYKEYGVAAHYLVDREGVVYQLVTDANVAYHAGVSSVPDGRTGVNEFSLGIEMMNTKSEKYTDKQYSSLNGLLASLKGKYQIKYVLGHNQIAPGRKDDPWNFQWGRIK